MDSELLESRVPRPRKPAEEHRKKITLTLPTQTLKSLDDCAEEWSLSVAQVAERAIDWYVVALENDPSLIKPPK